MSGFNKILVANRGEIAVRVMRTARKLGYRTVAVFSEADRGALHTQVADEAVLIGPAAVSDSYLVADNIIAAAKKTGAGAVHPGYGFLSENAAFCEKCTAAGITFIGPSAEAIELMGSKRLSKIAMLEAGVPCIPGYQGGDQAEQNLTAQAQSIGFPLMIKASAGGGGRGMRLVNDERQLAEQIRSASSEAQTAFGSGELILEKALLNPRHIEVQVFADRMGNTIYLGERDCSIQRRHQKVVEEAPSPFVDPELRETMGRAAVKAAKACNYVGAGTVEFLVDEDKSFYFLEMNTRLQVEHPVTEMITGLDLVALQLDVAAGKPLPLAQEAVEFRGHAVEVRIYAEDPRKDFAPQTGIVKAWQYPGRDNLRVDHGIATGQEVSPFYDPMLAKVIAHADERDDACRILASALQDIELLGVTSNRQFLQNILRHEVFRKGRATTSFITDHFSSDPSMDSLCSLDNLLAMAASIFFANSQKRNTNWQRSAASGFNYKLAVEDRIVAVEICPVNDQYHVLVNEHSTVLAVQQVEDNYCLLSQDNVLRRVPYIIDGNTIFIDDGSGHYCISDVTQQPAQAADGVGSGEIRAPMAGVICEVLPAKGESVQRGDTVIVLEAMKMEHRLTAAVNGIIDEINVVVGEQVSAGKTVVSIQAEKK